MNASGIQFDMDPIVPKAVWGFNGTDLDLDLAYDQWHNLAVAIQFVDGLNPDGTGNDIVDLYVNGSLAHTGTSWEVGYDANNSGQARSMDRLRFDHSGVISGLSGGGLYFDNVSISGTIPSSGGVIPEPGSVVIWSLLGGAALACGWRRRKR